MSVSTQDYSMVIAGTRESHVPFGGRAGSSSGVGRVGGSSVLEAFTGPKTVVVTLG